MSSVGIIAEEDSDVDVVRSVIRKITKRNYRVEKFVGHGCGKLHRKCRAWAVNLRDRGCKHLIVLRDSDDRNPAAVRNELVVALKPAPIASHVIVIPVREIEAWLLADQEAIGRVMHVSAAIRPLANPEAIVHPKERLRDLVCVRSDHRKRYVNSIHNGKIAELCSLRNLRRCVSFRPLEAFLRGSLH